MRFIGIDLAWTYKNETGLCVINDNGKIEYLKSAVFSDEDMVQIIKSCSHDDVCVAIDAPLIVNNETGSRAAEREFMKYKIHGHNLSLFVASRSYLTKTYGFIRGERLMRKIMVNLPHIQVTDQIIKGESSMLETFPSGICCGMFPEIYPVKYKIKRKVSYEETQFQMTRLLDYIRHLEVEKIIEGFDIGIENQDINKANHKHIEDKVDAFLSAYGPYAIYRGMADKKTFGSLEEGFITIPLKAVDSNYKVNEGEHCKARANMLTRDQILALNIVLGELSKSVLAGKGNQEVLFKDLKSQVLEIEKQFIK